MSIDELYQYLKLITPVGCRVTKESFGYYAYNSYTVTESIRVYHAEPKDNWYMTLTDLCLFKSKRGALRVYFRAMHLPTWFTTAFKLKPKPIEKYMFYVTPRF